MIFGVQRFIEDYLTRRGVDCSDDYAARAATVYVEHRGSQSLEELRERFSRIRTVIYGNAGGVNRKELETALVGALDRRFKKKK